MSIKFCFDFSLLSQPYRLQRCSFQMMHLALIAKNLGYEVSCVTSDDHLKQHKFISRIKDLLVYKVPSEVDVYVAKADAYYRDDNWDKVKKYPGFKVCLCNSDRTFRESSEPFKKHIGNPVQDRCDLYMPCNHTAGLLETHGHKVVPVSHPIDPRMFKFFVRNRLYQAFLMDELEKIRSGFQFDETGVAGFMGNSAPSSRTKAAAVMPNWCDFLWNRSKPPSAYIEWMCRRRACLDLRGNGDKSLRFSEACIFGRTLICQNLPSKYEPLLQNNVNCILVDDWAELSNVEVDLDHWRLLAEQSTADYKEGWSLFAQLRTMVRRSNERRESCSQSGSRV